MIVVLIVFFWIMNRNTETSKIASLREPNEENVNKETIPSRSLKLSKKDQTRNIKRIKISSDYYYQKTKKAKFQNLLDHRQPIFKMETNLIEIIREFKERSGLNVKLITANTPGYSHDTKCELRPESFFNEKQFNFEFENMPNEEMIRYFCISSNLKYIIDTYNQEILIADPGVILVKDFRDFSLVPKQFDSLIEKVFINKQIPSTAPRSVEQLKQAMVSIGIQLDAGTSITYENDQFNIILPKSEANFLLDFIEKIQ